MLSDKFDDIIKDLHEIYDVVMFDMPPVGVVTDGFAPMKKADLPIFVTKAEYTPRPYMRDVLNNKLVGIENYNRLRLFLMESKPNAHFMAVTDMVMVTDMVTKVGIMKRMKILPF